MLWERKKLCAVFVLVVCETRRVGDREANYLLLLLLYSTAEVFCNWPIYLYGVCGASVCLWREEGGVEG